MCTFLGEGRNLGPDDVMEAEIRQSRVLYVTGYLWDTDSQKRAVIRAIEIARQARAPVALSLSDTFCIERHHSDFRALLAESVDVVFGNADEALLLSACSEPEWAAAALGCGGRTAFVTLGASGAIAARDGAIVRVPAQAVEVVDTTGAGDAFAAGALFGLTHGADLANAAVEGIRLASRVVSKLGPRPDPN
jgi:sugar/nucleoside kinase (ribokinase family)